MRGTVVAVVLAAAGCYSPSPQTGTPCPDGVCPRPLVCSSATQTCERGAVDPDAAVDVAIDTPGPDSSIDAPPSLYAYRRRITIKNISATTMPAGYTIRVRIDLPSLLSASKVRADYADLRVIGDGAIGDRDRIVDPAGGQAPTAVNFSLATSLAPGGTTSVFALYYGRPTAPAAPANGSAVFQLYDDFASTIASFWMKNDAPGVVGGKLVLRANHTDGITTVAASDNVPIVSAVELVAKVVDPSSNPTVQTEGTFYYWFGYQHTGDFSASDPWVIWIARGKFGIGPEQKSPVGCEAECNGTPGSQDTATHYYEIQRDPTTTRFFRDGTFNFSTAVTNNADYSVMVRNFMESSDLQVDWIRARARVVPDAMVMLAAEEAL